MAPAVQSVNRFEGIQECRTAQQKHTLYENAQALRFLADAIIACHGTALVASVATSELRGPHMDIHAMPACSPSRDKSALLLTHHLI